MSCATSRLGGGAALEVGWLVVVTAHEVQTEPLQTVLPGLQSLPWAHGRKVGTRKAANDAG